MAFLYQLGHKRWAWLLLAAGAFTLELTALFFEHVMDLAPCVMCIYERVAIMGLIVSGLIAAIKPSSWLFRLIGIVGWGISSIWGLLIAIKHVDYQLNPSPFKSCDFFPNFPEWAPLHEWVPWLFNPTGFCSDIVWQFLGYTMPQWVLVSFALFVAIFAVVLIGQLLGLLVKGVRQTV